MKNRVLTVVGVTVLTLVLLSVTLALAQDVTPQGPVSPADEEARREIEAALAAQADPPPQFRAQSDFIARSVISAPLFIGVNDIDVPTYVIDPDNGDEFPLFDGFQVWGAAYDDDNNRILFNAGVQLFEWPLNGSPGLLGTITSSNNNLNLTMVGLAYHDGVLYGTTNIGTDPNPEAVYVIDTTTLKASVHITYNQSTATIDNGGLAVDADTGALYATNDSAKALVRIETNGDLTTIAPYPEGETDIDGLAVGRGIAYLVTDQPGDIFVYDLAAGEYVDPIPNPWATPELFAGAAWIEVRPPSIVMNKTVGTDPGECATETAITVAAGEEVTFCYQVENTSFHTLTRHDLEDSELGDILSDFTYSLVPGASAFITQTATITQTTTNTAVWTAYNPGPTDVVSATAEATVTVVPPSIVMNKTVGTDPGECATTSEIAVDPGTEVTYCYEVENTGLTALTRHELEDSELGGILSDFTYTLAPGASAFITQTATITQTTTNTAVWTAYNPGPTDVVSATAEATVWLAGARVDVDPASLSAHLDPDQQDAQTVTIGNVGTATLAWAVTVAPEDCAAPGPLSWVSFAPSVGTANPGETDELTVTFDATGLIEGSELAGVLCVTSNDDEQPVVAIPLSLTISGEPPISVTVYLPIAAGSSQD